LGCAIDQGLRIIQSPDQSRIDKMTVLLWGIVWGTIGGLLAWQVNFPGGAAVGSMIGCGLYSVLQSQGFSVPKPFELGAQIAVGIVVGFSFRRELLQSGLPVVVWGVIGAFTFLLVGIVLSWIASKLGYLHFNTALFGFSPGGFTNMAVMAAEEGAEPAPVALVHFIRVVLLFIIVPLMVRWLAR
jgi:membrane AbrB-like protein